MTENLDVTTRRANSDDVNLLAELGARTFRETFEADNTEEDMDAYLASSFNPAQQAAELADPAATFLIAEIGEVAAGYAKLLAGEPADGIEGAKPIELVRLYALREWLGSGVGQALMRACLDEARIAGHETLWLGVWERNPRAIAFYRKCGFTEVGTQTFLLGDDHQRDLVLERPTT